MALVVSVMVAICANAHNVTKQAHEQAIEAEVGHQVSAAALAAERAQSGFWLLTRPVVIADTGRILSHMGKDC